MVETSARGVRVEAVNSIARKGGVEPGQMLADARAILPGIITRPAEPERDAEDLARLALWIGRYGPNRNTEGTNGLWVDTTGVAHLFGDEEAMARDCVERLAKAGLHCRIAIADTRPGAAALARHANAITTSPPSDRRILISPPGEIRTSLSLLPVEGLQLSNDLVRLLHRLGLKRIGQLYTLPRAALARRFREGGKSQPRQSFQAHRNNKRPTNAQCNGWAETLLMRLDQALGELRTPSHGLTEPPVYRAQHNYADPLISHDGVLAALDSLTAELCHRMQHHREGARALRFVIFRADKSVTQTQVRTSRAASSPAHIIDLLKPRLEAVDAGLGIDTIILEALETEPLADHQTTLTRQAGPEGLHRHAPTVLIDRLSNRLGSQAVFHLAPCASHIPEQAQRRVAALEWHAPTARQTGEASAESLKPPRPTLLLAPAEAIDVIAEVPDGPPVRFLWRRLMHRVVRAEGPERIEPEWWHQLERFTPQPPCSSPDDPGQSPGQRQKPPELRARDYYRLEDQYGGLYWIYRAGLYDRADILPDVSSPIDLSPADLTQSDTIKNAPSAAASSAPHASPPPRWFLHGIF